MKIRNGDIVRLKDGREGMITWRRNNEQIGINISHYMIVKEIYKDRGPAYIKKMTMSLGADDEFSKDQIQEILTPINP